MISLELGLPQVFIFSGNIPTQIESFVNLNESKTLICHLQSSSITLSTLHCFALLISGYDGKLFRRGTDKTEGFIFYYSHVIEIKILFASYSTKH